MNRNKTKSPYSPCTKSIYFDADVLRAATFKHLKIITLTKYMIIFSDVLRAINRVWVIKRECQEGRKGGVEGRGGRKEGREEGMEGRDGGKGRRERVEGKGGRKGWKERVEGHKKTPTLWIHKIGVYKAVNLLHQFDGCEGFSFYFFRGIRGFSCRPIEVYRLTEAAVAP